MRCQASVVCGVGVVLTLAGVNFWQVTATEQVKDEAVIQRGAYLVNQVAHCGDCHTPRNERGELDKSKHLQGAPTWFTTSIKFKKWDTKVPDITASGKAGKWTEERLVKFFSTGEQANMPMPAYTLTVEDAKAVTAYLRSLPGAKK